MTSYAQVTAGPKTWTSLWYVAPLTASAYPLLLMAFHGSVGTSWALAGMWLLLAFAMPVIALLVAERLAASERPTAAELLARRVALLSVAAPAIYTFLGVITFMLGVGATDVWAFWILWGALAVTIAMAESRTPLDEAPSPARPRPRVVHGVVALAVVVVFLCGHIANHFFGLAGPSAHKSVAKVLRYIYRQPVVEPLLLAAFIFQVVSGGYLAWRLTAKAMDGFRTFQTASGVFLMVFVVSHINAVFVLARNYLNIDSNWGFATGAPTGLIQDAWNVRLVPLYGFAVFFVLSHLAAGARIVLLAHGSSKKLADRLQVWGTGLSAVIAVVILLGMCGLRFPGA